MYAHVHVLGRERLKRIYAASFSLSPSRDGKLSTEVRTQAFVNLPSNVRTTGVCVDAECTPQGS